MSRLIGLGLAAAFLLPLANPDHEKFGKYRAVEAYEIRPGILMMPTRSADGQLCEIGLEKLHYSPQLVRLESSLSRKEIDEIIDELVPADERGPKSKDFDEPLITESGHSLTTDTEFEHVSVQIYSDTSSTSGQSGITANDVVATIKWKNRHCQ